MAVVKRKDLLRDHREACLQVVNLLSQELHVAYAPSDFAAPGGPGPLVVRRLGWTELAHAVAFGILLIIGFYLHG